MPGRAFEAQVKALDGTTVIELSGDVNRGAEVALDAAYSEAAGPGNPVVLDFADVDYINSTGIAVIVGILARARAAGTPVRAYGLSDHYREIFSITRISDFMTIYDDEAAALAVG